MDIKMTVLARDFDRAEEMASLLIQRGFMCFVSTFGEVIDNPPGEVADLVIADLESVQSIDDVGSLLQRIQDQQRLPVIALVDGPDLMDLDKVSEVGDFVLKPVRMDELVVRIHRAFQRAQGDGNGARMRFGNLTIDTEGCQVYLNRRAVALTFKEYELFAFLARNPGKVFTRRSLLDQVWGYDYYGGERTVDVHVRRLRSKLELGGHTFIETARGAGYRFEASMESDTSR